MVPPLIAVPTCNPEQKRAAFVGILRNTLLKEVNLVFPDFKVANYVEKLASGDPPRAVLIQKKERKSRLVDYYSRSCVLYLQAKHFRTELLTY